MTKRGRSGSALMVAAMLATTLNLTSLHAQQPTTRIELDAATMAARTDAARAIIPLLHDVRERATSRMQVDTGGAPPSPFTGTQTTLFSVTLGKRKPVDPQVVEAIDRLLKWEPGNRSATYEAALFDRWFDQLSARASSISTQRGQVSCDTACVARTMTALDETWGKASDRAETRDEVLLETLVEAVKEK